MTQGPLALEEIYRGDRKHCLRRTLVLEAAGIPFRIYNRPGESVIVVAASVADRARAELTEYAAENRPVPVPRTIVFEPRNGWIGVVGYATVLTGVFFLQHERLLGQPWLEAGQTQAGAIRSGELWRAVTALSLHRDAIHLLGNLTFGGLIGYFAGRLFGSGLAWCGVLLAGTGGNLINAWVRDTQHRSIGASTAVFAGFGMVGAFAAIHRHHIHASKFARYTPIIGAVVLLGYLGTSGERTDVMAHVGGFVTGLLFGALLGKSGLRAMPGARAQVALGLGTVCLVVVSWFVALTRYLP